MSELVLKNQNPILLTCRIANGTLELSHEGVPLPDGSMTVALDDGGRTQIWIADFAQDGVRFRAYASTIQDEGFLAPWRREDSGVRSPEIMAPDLEQRMRVQVQAMGYDVVEAVSARERKDYTFPSYTDPIDVWIPKKGSKPTP